MFTIREKTSLIITLVDTGRLIIFIDTFFSEGHKRSMIAKQIAEDIKSKYDIVRAATAVFGNGSEMHFSVTEIILDDNLLQWIILMRYLFSYLI